MEARYSQSAQLWSGKPNRALVDFASTLRPGTALDVGCGEGADLQWLSDQGWEATGIDFAPTAVKRTRERGLRAYLSSLKDFDHPPFDLVNVQFGGIPATAAAVAKLESLVAPGGKLLFVHHDWESTEMAMPAWLANNLQQLEVIEYRKLSRAVNTGAGAGHAYDLVLTAERR
ncbi:class I SAM-dependent methyltransferase [Corynebacterium phocae]|nr:methyltransferase domain-containing protein [Corynebacterium phocae]KAA8723588.1 class I SAM-dependent methyltransferase [Corynebacterium phocae]